MGDNHNARPERMIDASQLAERTYEKGTSGHHRSGSGRGPQAIERAKQIVLEYQRLPARDAVHLSVMEQCQGSSKTRAHDIGMV
jgi:hypothetical protein